MTTLTSTLAALHAAVAGDPVWERYVQRIGVVGAEGVGLHIAILVNPYLQRILNGQKTIESRFSSQRRTPYECVDPGDVLLFKLSGGPIQGIGRVASAQFLKVTPEVLQDIQIRYADALGVTDPAFWEARSGASFATLLHLENVREITPITFTKRDQRAWIVLNQRATQEHLPLA